jgi:hypothetical protein
VAWLWWLLSTRVDGRFNGNGLLATGHPSTERRTYHRRMHLRRAVLLMALVLGVVALVEALVPVPRERRATGEPATPRAPRPSAPLRTLAVRYPAPKRVPRLRAAPGAHVVVEVSTSVAGEASIGGLGLVQPAEPATPARFDVLVGRPGTYAVAFEPAAGRPATVARLVVAGRG